MQTNFVLGHIFMWLARHEIKQNPDLIATKPLQLVCLWTALIFCPTTGWSFYAYPGWATVYLRPEFLIPAWSGPVIVSFYFLGMVFGALIAQYAIQKNQMKVFYGTLALGIFWLLSTTILTLDEYTHIGTYSAYHAGQAKPISEDPAFMKAMNIMGAILGVSGGGLALYLWRRSQRIKYIFRAS